MYMMFFFFCELVDISSFCVFSRNLQRPVNVTLPTNLVNLCKWKKK